MAESHEEYRQRCADSVDEACSKLAAVFDNVVILANSQNKEEGTVAYSRHEGNLYAIQAQIAHWAQTGFGTGPRGVNWIDRADDNQQSESEAVDG